MRVVDVSRGGLNSLDADPVPLRRTRALRPGAGNAVRIVPRKDGGFLIGSKDMGNPRWTTTGSVSRALGLSARLDGGAGSPARSEQQVERDPLGRRFDPHALFISGRLPRPIGIRAPGSGSELGNATYGHLERALAALPERAPAGRETARPVNVALLVDGPEGCGGDSCAVAPVLHRQLPVARMHAIARAPAADVPCSLFGETSGAFLEATEAGRVVFDLRRVTGRLMDAKCHGCQLPSG